METTKPTRGFKRIIISAVIGLASGLANGLFGAGGGSLLVPCMERFLHTETHKSHATAIAVILPISIVSIFVYRRTDFMPSMAFGLSVGGVFGGLTGAMLLKKLSSNALHKIFGLFMIAAAIKMIL